MHPKRHLTVVSGLVGGELDRWIVERAAAQVRKERVSPAQYVREVRDEMRKVAWPRWPEVRRYAIIVLVTVVIITAYVGGLDAVFGILSGWLYKD
ncbi:MAG: preprotein translocase subunit SecE [Actinobacteria bacterium]|nr:preprotein translocase subunit SecE [Actinomycetota bacterium]